MKYSVDCAHAEIYKFSFYGTKELFWEVCGLEETQMQVHVFDIQVYTNLKSSSEGES